jgi:hypothetical protein
VVFLCKHPDLVQTIGKAGRTRPMSQQMASPADKARDQIITALRRRLDEMKQQLAAKDRELRERHEKSIGSMENWQLRVHSPMRRSAWPKTHFRSPRLEVWLVSETKRNENSKRKRQKADRGFLRSTARRAVSSSLLSYRICQATCIVQTDDVFSGRLRYAFLETRSDGNPLPLKILRWSSMW